MKYIDADRLRAEIEKIYKSEIQPWLSGVSATSAIYDYVLPLINSLQQEQPDFPPINPDDAMKELDEKIALVKQRKTWDGVDVDKYMDEVRGREPGNPMGLEEEVKRYYSDNFAYISSDQPTLSILTNIARHFAQWGAEHLKK